jgi:hypothetical protein
MEVPQGKSLCSYLKQATMSFFFIHKIREQVGKTSPAWEGGSYQWEGRGGGERVREGEYSENSVYTCM